MFYVYDDDDDNWLIDLVHLMLIQQPDEIVNCTAEVINNVQVKNKDLLLNYLVFHLFFREQ